MKKLLVMSLILIGFVYAENFYLTNREKLVNCKLRSVLDDSYEIIYFNNNQVGSVKIINASDIYYIGYTKYDSNLPSSTIDLGDLLFTKVALHKLSLKNKSTLASVQREEKEIYNSSSEKDKNIAVSPTTVNYHTKINIPLLATGTALSAVGINNLINAIKLHNTFGSYIPKEVKKELAKSYCLSFMLTTAGFIDICFSFHRVFVEVENNSLAFSYKF